MKWLFRHVRIAMEPPLQQSQATWSPPAWDLRRNDGWQICPGSFCPRTRTWATWCFSGLLYWKGGQWKVHLERGIIWIIWWYLKYECMSNLIEPWYLLWSSLAAPSVSQESPSSVASSWNSFSSWWSSSSPARRAVGLEASSWAQVKPAKNLVRIKTWWRYWNNTINLEKLWSIHINSNDSHEIRQFGDSCPYMHNQF